MREGGGERGGGGSCFFLICLRNAESAGRPSGPSESGGKDYSHATGQMCQRLDLCELY